jgi:hypothetical protein
MNFLKTLAAELYGWLGTAAEIHYVARIIRRAIAMVGPEWLLTDA